MRIVQWSQDQMKALREYAEAHPMKALDVIEGRSPPAGDIPGHVLVLEGGMRVVYSIESDQPAGPSRHLSVSVDTPRMRPNAAAVQVIAEELGFRPQFADGSCWQDDDNQALNWVQTIAPPTRH